MEWLIIVGVLVGIIGGSLGALSFFRTVRRQRPRFRITTDAPVLVFGHEGKAEFLVFEATISNLSDAANSVVEYGLVVGHPYSVTTTPIRYSETPVGESVLETEDGAKRRAIARTRFDWLQTPVNLAPHSSRSGHIGFPLPSIARDIVKAVEYALIVIPSEGEASLIPLVLDIYEWRLSTPLNDE